MSTAATPAGRHQAIRHIEVLRDLIAAGVIGWLTCLINQATFGVRLVALPSLSRTLQRLLEIPLAMVVITGFVHGAGLPISLLAAEAVGWGVCHDRASRPTAATPA